MGEVQDNALWSCVHRGVLETRLLKVDKAWRVTIVLSCGHEAHQEFRVPDLGRGFSHRRLARAADEGARDKATRAQTALLASRKFPCIVCGPA